MPSLSPGPESYSSFAQILPGAPIESLQSLTTFTFRWKRYVVYISGNQLNILRSPNELVQAVTFEEKLVAVKAEGEQSAKVAVASEGNVWVLEPETDNWNRVTWRKALLLRREDAGDKTRSLSWGDDGELLVGGTRLVSLFSVLPSSREGTPVRAHMNAPPVEERHVLWSKSLPSAVQIASFSPSASLIASCGPRDRLVKIWRRLSFEEGLFDYAYLPHPAAVTHIEWREPDPPKLEEDAEESDEARAKAYGTRNDEDQELLYTFCADGVLRVWKTGGQNDLEILKLHTQIDLVTAIPHSPSLSSKGADPPKPPRYAFILRSGAVSGAIGAAISKHQIGTVTHSLEHLKEISTRQPDAVATFDGNGRMSAWGLQTIGHKRRPSTPSGNTKQAYHIAHAEDLDMKLPPGTNVRFETWFDGDQLNVLVHQFDGSIDWWKGDVEQFFSPAARGSDRLAHIGRWTGTQDAIVGLRHSSATGRLLAWSQSGVVTELHTNKEGELQVGRRSKPPPGSQNAVVLDAYELEDQFGTLCVSNTAIFILHTSGRITSSVDHQLKSDKGLQILALTSQDIAPCRTFLLFDYSGSYDAINLSKSTGTSDLQLTLSGQKQLPLLADSLDSEIIWRDVHITSHPRRTSWLRLVGIDQEGVLSRRDVPAQSLQNEEVKATEASLSFPSDFTRPSFIEATDSVAAIASNDSRSINIMDLKDGYVEHRQRFIDEVHSMRLSICTDFPSHRGDANSTLAVAQRASVEILAQARYEPAQSAEQHTWHHLKSISIFGIGPTISSLAWTSSGELAIAAGNAIFRINAVIAGNEVMWELRDRIDMSESAEVQSHSLMSALRQPLVSWHPHFLQQLGLRGRLHTAAGILRRLERTLRFYTEGDELHPMLNASPTDISADKDHPDNAFLDYDSVNSLTQQLEDIDLPKTSDAEQERLKLVFQTIVYVQDHMGSLDENALRYLFSWKLHVLELDSHRTDDKVTSNGEAEPPRSVPAMSWREIVFAYHSETQQPLLEALHAYYGSKLDWPAVRKLGIPAWLHAVRAAQSEGSDLASLEQIFDSLAQTSFRSVYPPDPTRASLYFLALKKKATLLALWRVAVGNKEQKSTSNFLKRDFSAEENRTAARKNAYALMGKRRFEYAAAFFLLADDPASAIRILAGQCQDLPLAIAVARVYCDDGSPELLKFMEDRVLPEARKAGDRWLLSWVHEIMGHTSLAAQALVVPIDQLEVDEAERMPRSWQQDDPLTLRLYQHLRDKPAKPGQKGARSLGGEQYEYRAVLRSARILRKMGLWLLALELVSTWHFKPVETAPPVEETNGATVSNGVHDKPPTAQGPASSMLDDIETPSAPAQTPKSMLDDFGSSNTAPPKSMLDGFESLSLEPKVDTAKDGREAKAAELLAKIKAKKEQASKPPEEEKQKQPTQFKEPEASSILDSFGF